jgi:Cu2+-exporting ATPase
MKEIKLTVKGMHCASCEALITEELDEITGVSKSRADHRNGVVTLEAADNVDVTKIRDKIKSLGYEVL